jgi:hypothetical protein
LDVGDEYAMTVAADNDGVGVWHVDEAATLDAVGVPDIEADVVFDIEFPMSFVVL